MSFLYNTTGVNLKYAILQISDNMHNNLLIVYIPQCMIKNK